MKILQISVFVENRAEHLHAVTRVIGQAGANIRALSLADTTDFCVLRMVVNDADLALRALKASDYTVSETPVLAVEVPDRPGGLAGVLGAFSEADVTVEYLYAFLAQTKQGAAFVFRVKNIEDSAARLKEKGIRLLTQEEIAAL